MTDFAVARRMMVDNQVRTSDVTDLRVLAPMLEVPRENFLPPESAELAYLDLDIPVSRGEGGKSRRLLTPRVLAKLLQAADVVASDRVLDVGAGGGYAAAILAQLAGSVIALDEDAALLRRTKDATAGLMPANIEVVSGPLVQGWPAGAPYDVILVEGAMEVPPKALFRQLKDGGRLVGIEGCAPGKAMVYSSVAGEVSGRPIFDAAAAVLPGFSKPTAFVF